MNKTKKEVDALVEDAKSLPAGVVGAIVDAVKAAHADTVTPFTRQVSEVLDCVLTDDEQRDRGRQLADALAAVGAFESKQKNEKQIAKDALETLEGECARLAGIVRAGKEPRTIPVRVVHDDKRLMVDKIRLDTGEVFASRTMTEFEKQRALPFPQKAVGN